MVQKSVIAIACGLLLIGCLSGCGDDFSYPQEAVQIQHMKSTCTSRRGVRDWHSVIGNPGNLVLWGEIDFTCSDGYIGQYYWNSEGPDHLVRHS
jgi:hypothetical protein